MSISRHPLDPNNKEPSLPMEMLVNVAYPSPSRSSSISFFFRRRMSRSTFSEKRKNARNESVEDDNWEKSRLFDVRASRGYVESWYPPLFTSLFNKVNSLALLSLKCLSNPGNIYLTLLEDCNRYNILRISFLKIFKRSCALSNNKLRKN